MPRKKERKRSQNEDMMKHEVNPKGIPMGNPKGNPKAKHKGNGEIPREHKVDKHRESQR